MLAARARRRSGLPPIRPRQDADRDFKLGVKWSLGAHAAVLVFALVKSLIFPGIPLPFIPALRVDIVGLPDVLKKDVQALAPSKEVADALKNIDQAIKKEIEKTKDEMILKPKHATDKKERQKRIRSALDRIKSLAKLTDTEKKTGLVKGNKVSPGTSLSPDAREAAEASYFDLIRDRLQGNWALPVWLSRQDLSAQVVVYIDLRGNLKNFQIVKSSGNAQFDEAVKKTLADSQPFPIPPDGISGVVASDGIMVGFPL
ncbi:cell envelope integrity protein TolA [Bdellovibrionota bacterium FG-2]